VLGPVAAPTAELALTVGAGVRGIDLPPDPGDAFAAGTAAADDEIEEGADLVVLAAGTGTTAAGALVSVVTGAEPTALLPRGARAIDTAQWIARAARLRDTRHAVAHLRTRPDELLAALGSPPVSAAAGFALRAATRRTPLVLDGLPVVAAALLCFDIQSRARDWWQVADTSDDRAHARALELLELRPLLDLGTSAGDGLTGLLAVAVLRAAVTTGAADG
jgi:nicotinate-nucleotide--dimethylbenzimidazole phosphoribosyltransferase